MRTQTRDEAEVRLNSAKTDVCDVWYCNYYDVIPYFVLQECGEGRANSSARKGAWAVK
jgi:hypothetical protein